MQPIAMLWYLRTKIVGESSKNNSLGQGPAYAVRATHCIQIQQITLRIKYSSYAAGILAFYKKKSIFSLSTPRPRSMFTIIITQHCFTMLTITQHYLGSFDVAVQKQEKVTV